MVKRLPVVRETPVRSLGWGDPLEKEMATHCRTLAWKIPWTEESGRLQCTELEFIPGSDFKAQKIKMKRTAQDFPGSSVVKNPDFHCRVHGF